MKIQKGITLIALIITIIVMLILVGVSVSLYLNTGLFKTAQDIAKNTELEKLKEQGLSGEKILVKDGDIEKLVSINDFLGNNSNITGIPPLTLLNSKGANLVEYKICGYGKQELLPQEYQEVEYLESAGISYINTGVIPTNNTSIELIYQSLSYTTSQYILGSRPGTGTIFLAINGAGGRTDWDIRINGSAIFSNVARTDDKYKSIISLTDGKGSWTLTNLNTLQSNTFAINTTSFNATEPLFLFGYNEQQRLSNLRIYENKIYEGNEMIRHFIPCYRKLDNILGMYDLVNDKFYPNNGTGVFARGSEVKGVGEKTNNLLNENGFVNGKYINSSGTVSRVETLRHSENIAVAPNTKYVLSGVKGETNNIIAINWFDENNAFISRNAKNIQSEGKFELAVTSPENASYCICNLIIDTTENQFERGTVSTDYEPYGYKIPVKVSNNTEEILTNIYIDKPLTGDEYISYKEHNLPEIPTYEGTTIIETCTTVQPSNMEIVYKAE